MPTQKFPSPPVAKKEANSTRINDSSYTINRSLLLTDPNPDHLVSWIDSLKLRVNDTLNKNEDELVQLRSNARKEDLKQKYRHQVFLEPFDRLGEALRKNEQAELPEEDEEFIEEEEQVPLFEHEDSPYPEEESEENYFAFDNKQHLPLPEEDSDIIEIISESEMQPEPTPSALYRGEEDNEDDQDEQHDDFNQFEADDWEESEEELEVNPALYRDPRQSYQVRDGRPRLTDMPMSKNYHQYEDEDESASEEYDEQEEQSDEQDPSEEQDEDSDENANVFDTANAAFNALADHGLDIFVAESATDGYRQQEVSQYPEETHSVATHHKYSDENFHGSSLHQAALIAPEDESDDAIMILSSGEEQKESEHDSEIEALADYDSEEAEAESDEEEEEAEEETEEQDNNLFAQNDFGDETNLFADIAQEALANEVDTELAIDAITDQAEINTATFTGFSDRGLSDYPADVESDGTLRGVITPAEPISAPFVDHMAEAVPVEISAPETFHLGTEAGSKVTAEDASEGSLGDADTDFKKAESPEIEVPHPSLTFPVFKTIKVEAPEILLEQLKKTEERFHIRLHAVEELESELEITRDVISDSEQINEDTINEADETSHNHTTFFDAEDESLLEEVESFKSKLIEENVSQDPEPTPEDLEDIEVTLNPQNGESEAEETFLSVISHFEEGNDHQEPSDSVIDRLEDDNITFFNEIDDIEKIEEDIEEMAKEAEAERIQEESEFEGFDASKDLSEPEETGQSQSLELEYVIVQERQIGEAIEGEEQIERPDGEVELRVEEETSMYIDAEGPVDVIQSTYVPILGISELEKEMLSEHNPVISGETGSTGSQNTDQIEEVPCVDEIKIEQIEKAQTASKSPEELIVTLEEVSFPVKVEPEETEAEVAETVEDVDVAEVTDVVMDVLDDVLQMESSEADEGVAQPSSSEPSSSDKGSGSEDNAPSIASREASSSSEGSKYQLPSQDLFVVIEPEVVEEAYVEYDMHAVVEELDTAIPSSVEEPVVRDIATVETFTSTTIIEVTGDTTMDFELPTYIVEPPEVENEMVMETFEDAVDPVIPSYIDELESMRNTPIFTQSTVSVEEVDDFYEVVEYTQMDSVGEAVSSDESTSKKRPLEEGESALSPSFKRLKSIINSKWNPLKLFSRSPSKKAQKKPIAEVNEPPVVPQLKEVNTSEGEGNISSSEEEDNNSSLDEAVPPTHDVNNDHPEVDYIEEDVITLPEESEPASHEESSAKEPFAQVENLETQGDVAVNDVQESLDIEEGFEPYTLDDIVAENKAELPSNSLSSPSSERVSVEPGVANLGSVATMDIVEIPITADLIDPEHQVYETQEPQAASPQQEQDEEMLAVGSMENSTGVYVDDEPHSLTNASDEATDEEPVVPEPAPLLQVSKEPSRETLPSDNDIVSIAENLAKLPQLPLIQESVNLGPKRHLHTLSELAKIVIKPIISHLPIPEPIPQESMDEDHIADDELGAIEESIPLISDETVPASHRTEEIPHFNIISPLSETLVTRVPTEDVVFEDTTDSESIIGDLVEGFVPQEELKEIASAENDQHLMDGDIVSEHEATGDQEPDLPIKGPEAGTVDENIPESSTQSSSVAVSRLLLIMKERALAQIETTHKLDDTESVVETVDEKKVIKPEKAEKRSKRVLPPSTRKLRSQDTEKELDDEVVKTKSPTSQEVTLKEETKLEEQKTPEKVKHEATEAIIPQRTRRRGTRRTSNDEFIEEQEPAPEPKPRRSPRKVSGNSLPKVVGAKKLLESSPTLEFSPPVPKLRTASGKWQLDLLDHPALRTRSKSPLKRTLQELSSELDEEHPRKRRTRSSVKQRIEQVTKDESSEEVRGRTRHR